MLVFEENDEWQVSRRCDIYRRAEGAERKKERQKSSELLSAERDKKKGRREKATLRHTQQGCLVKLVDGRVNVDMETGRWMCRRTML